MEIRLTALSSLHRVFPDECPDGISPVFTMLGNELFCWQLAFTAADFPDNAADAVVTVDCALPVEVCRIANVPVMRPVYAHSDTHYNRTAPGLYPDPLLPLIDGHIRLLKGVHQALWLTVNPERDTLTPGEYPLTVTITADGCTRTLTAALTVLPALLPEQTFICTNWLHCDCICDAHSCEPFSERFWDILARYVHTAALYGQKMVLTPAFTPPLDTPVGGERKTVQLVGVTRDGDTYRFDFTLLDRFIKLCEGEGMRYFEHSHLFTQWGAAHAPKIMATVDDVYRRLFGWDTDACGGEYTAFLTAYLTALRGYLETSGVGKRMYFHISDEPGLSCIENYGRAKAMLRELLAGYRQFDALSEYEFYARGLVDIPVAATSSIGRFLGRCEELWAYYTGGQSFDGLSNRFIAVPPVRNRVLGLQLYRADIRGFLHWGYNFWYTTLSRYRFDPYLSPDADMSFVGGTSFLVYPGTDGAVKSTRLAVFGEAMQDIRVLKLLESLAGRDFVDTLLDEAFPGLDFHTCPDTPDALLNLRARVNQEIARRV